MPTPTPGYAVTNTWDVNDILEITAEGMNEGTPWAAIRHYKITAIGNANTVASDVAQFWETNFFAGLADELTTQWRAECVTISRVAPAPRNVEFFPFTAIPGTIATDGVANATAFLYRFATAVVGSRGRGRMFVPGLPEEATNGGLVTAAAATDLQAVGDLLAQDIGAGGNNMEAVVFSRTTFNELANGFTEVAYVAALGNIAPNITTVQVVGNLASQRDRRYRRNVLG